MIELAFSALAMLAAQFQKKFGIDPKFFAGLVAIFISFVIQFFEVLKTGSIGWQNLGDFGSFAGLVWTGSIGFYEALKNKLNLKK